MSDDAGHDERPVGRIEPDDDAIRDLRADLADQEFEDALEQIEDLELDGELADDWLGYYRGLALLGTRELDDAFETFQETYSRVVTSTESELGDARFRVAAKCLKKMGWYHRRGRGYERAYACHSMEYDLVERHGSNLEVHDAALSLDVVAYNLRAPQVSKMWLERSVEAAEAIDNETYRVKALGLSWNNLAGTLCDIASFEEAAEAADRSLENWERYEDLEGEDENRVVWAKHIMGDVYKRWGDHFAEQDETEPARERLERARDVLEEAVEEANAREMSDEDLGDIRGKLEDVQSSLSELNGDGSAGETSQDEADREGDGEAEQEEPDEEASDAEEESDESADGDAVADDEED